MNSNRTLTIRTADDARHIGTLDLFATIEVRGSDLRVGMVVCDSLDTAYIVLNERLSRGSRDAGKSFAGHSPETGRYIDHAFHDNTTYRVATHRLQSCGRCVRANPGAVDWGCTCDMTADEAHAAAVEFARMHD